METTEVMPATLEVSDYSPGFVLRTAQSGCLPQHTWPASVSYPCMTHSEWCATPNCEWPRAGDKKEQWTS